MNLRNLALALLLLGGTLAGCGRQAEFERPRPLIGKPRQPSAAQLNRDAAAARARADGAVKADPQAPQSVDEVRDRVPTQRENPVAGAPVGPNPPRPPGVLPDPVARPSSIPQ